jgi:NAD(P)-dependent dehydrogenase (short-subunit alcohol dehydrogenase family)
MNNMKKTVLITGTSSGFGKATVRHFAKHGWNVIATMRQPAIGPELTGLGQRIGASARCARQQKHHGINPGGYPGEMEEAKSGWEKKTVRLRRPEGLDFCR